jgi:hypothetical protein
VSLIQAILITVAIFAAIGGLIKLAGTVSIKIERRGDQEYERRD